MRWLVFFLALGLGLALDLGTKEVAFERLPGPAATVALTSWFSFTHAENRGAAFGLFQDQHTFFMLVSLLAFVVVPYLVQTARVRPKRTALVLGLVLAGVVGNFWDRVVHGFVRDFLDLHAPRGGALAAWLSSTVGRDTYPTFNVADVFITCGAVVAVLVLSREGPQPAPATPAPAGSDAGATPASPAPASAEPAAPSPDDRRDAGGAAARDAAAAAPAAAP